MFGPPTVAIFRDVLLQGYVTCYTERQNDLTDKYKMLSFK